MPRSMYSCAYRGASVSARRSACNASGWRLRSRATSATPRSGSGFVAARLAALAYASCAASGAPSALCAAPKCCHASANAGATRAHPRIGGRPRDSGRRRRTRRRRRWRALPGSRVRWRALRCTALPPPRGARAQTPRCQPRRRRAPAGRRRRPSPPARPPRARALPAPRRRVLSFASHIPSHSRASAPTAAAPRTPAAASAAAAADRSRAAASSSRPPVARR